MEHLILGTYLVSFLFLFGLLVYKYQLGGFGSDGISRGLFWLQAAIGLNTLMVYVVRYIWINLNTDTQKVLNPYPLIMLGFFLVLYAMLFLGMQLLKLRIKSLRLVILAGIVLGLYVYDLIFPRYDWVLHPYYSIVDYVFYITALVLGGVLVFQQKLYRYLTVLAVLPFAINEQLEFWDLGIQVLPILTTLVGITVLVDIKKLKKSVQSPQKSRDVMKALGFSDRETAVGEALLEGLDNQGIATRLFISITTVKTHLYRMYKKAGVSSRLELVQLIRSRISPQME